MDERSPTAEVALIEEARKGSREAFREIIRLHQARVRAYLSRFVRNRDVIDELAQVTFVAAYRSLDAYKPEVPFAGWLLRITRNRALVQLREDELHRRHQREGFARAFAQVRAQVAEADSEGPDAGRELEALRACVEQLPQLGADLVRDHYFHGKTAVEIARTTGRGKSAVTMALLRVRHALRECVKKRLVAAEPGR